ncbi:MAG: porin family protein, partial [Rhizorhabdus sp.]
YTSTFANISDAVNGDGYRLGAGAEVKLGKSAYTKIEYRFSDYEGGYERHQVIGGIGLAL